MTIISLSGFKMTCLCCHGPFEEDFNVYFLLQSLVPGIKWIRIIITFSVKLTIKFLFLTYHAVRVGFWVGWRFILFIF